MRDQRRTKDDLLRELEALRERKTSDKGRTKAQLIQELESLRLKSPPLNPPAETGSTSAQPATAESDLFYSLATIASSQMSSDEALQQCLDIVCEYLGWPVGHLYIEASDGTGELAPTTIWHLDNPQEFETFRTATEKTRFAPGIGLPGRVLSSEKPAWISDVMQDPNFPRNKLAAGRHAGVSEEADSHRRRLMAVALANHYLDLLPA